MEFGSLRVFIFPLAMLKSPCDEVNNVFSQHSFSFLFGRGPLILSLLFYFLDVLFIAPLALFVAVEGLVVPLNLYRLPVRHLEITGIYNLFRSLSG